MLPEASEHPIGPWRITHTVLRIELANDSVRVENDMHVERVEGEPFGPLVLDGRALELLEVALDGATLAADRYELSDRTMSIELADSPHVVRTVTAAIPGGANDSGFTRRPGLLSTNCEPQGFRRITYFLDRPAVRATYDVTLVADPIAFPVMLANGHHVGEGTLPDGRHWARFDDPITKPSYLFAVVAGDLSIESRPYVTGSGRTIRLAVAAPPDQIDGVEYALHSMADAMSYDEAHGGIEHDLDVLTFVSIPGYPDATEYHGLMFFESGVLVVDTRGYVDDDLLLISANVAHEYGHHTRGNRITVRTWGQLALKEGLTVLTAQNDYRRHMFGPVARVLDVLDLRRVQFPEEITIGAPVVRGEVSDPSALYTRTTYLKGAEVFGMLRTLVGPERWAEAFGQFVLAYDLGAVGVAEFVQVVRQVAPQHAAAIDGISRWFTLAGRPAIDIEVGPTGLEVRRTDALTDDPPVSMPVVLGFRDLAGAPLAVQLDDGPIAAEHTVVLAERQRSLRVRSAVPFVLSPLRGYSSPVDLRCELPSDQLATLLVHDDDPFARWWASEELMIRVIDAHRGGDDARADAAMSALSGALAAVVPAEPDPVLLAQLLAVPDEFMLGDREQRIDVDGVARGLEFLRGRLGREVRQPLLDALERFSRDQATGTSPADIGARMLVEPVLAPLLATGDSDGMQLAMQELRSPNATRAMRAFGQLAHLDSVALDDLVALTYERWQHAPKLIDRWLRAQSGSRRSDTVERVATLASGPLYDRADRARVMGVWFPFATRNRAVFHHPSGEGYRVFVDELGELMPVNAGLAVRLVGDLLQFRRFDDHRAALMRAELTRMADMQGMPDFAVGILRNLLT
jgi:aminopeptidase N